jgi:hypothetical protein
MQRSSRNLLLATLVAVALLSSFAFARLVSISNDTEQHLTLEVPSSAHRSVPPGECREPNCVNPAPGCRDDEVLFGAGRRGLC